MSVVSGKVFTYHVFSARHCDEVRVFWSSLQFVCKCVCVCVCVCLQFVCKCVCVCVCV